MASGCQTGWCRSRAITESTGKLPCRCQAVHTGRLQTQHRRQKGRNIPNPTSPLIWTMGLPVINIRSQTFTQMWACMRTHTSLEPRKPSGKWRKNGCPTVFRANVSLFGGLEPLPDASRGWGSPVLPAAAQAGPVPSPASHTTGRTAGTPWRSSGT